MYEFKYYFIQIYFDNDMISEFKRRMLALHLWCRMYAWDIFCYGHLLLIGLVIFYRFAPVPCTPIMCVDSIKNGTFVSYEWIDYDQMSPYVKVCAMAAEDQNLPFHNGIDWSAMWQAYKYNATGKRLRGGSTITQQVAKNVFLWHGRSYLRKVLEGYITLWIELLWTKERILEVYLNIAEMGKNTYGVKAAAQLHFGKSAHQISLLQAALLVAVLPNPKKYNASRPSVYVQKRARQISTMYYQLDGNNYLRELLVRSDKSLYDFSKYK